MSAIQSSATTQTELSLQELVEASRRLASLLGSDPADDLIAQVMQDNPRDDPDWDPYSACRPKPRPPGEARVELRLENLTLVEVEQEAEEQLAAAP